jgi:hypothetical protein
MRPIRGLAHAAGAILYHDAGNRPCGSRLLRLLVLGRDALEGHDEVLQRALLLATLGRLAVHEVVEADAVLQHVVKTTHDAEDAEREDPDTDDGHNRSLLALHEPTKDTEQGGDNVDDQDSTSQLPRGERRPEGAIGTRNILVLYSLKKIC